MGGTKIASALVEENLELRNLQVVPTSQTDLVSQLTELIKNQDNFDAIGLAMPGQVLSDGTIIRLPNIANFETRNFKQLLEEKFKVPVSVVNDAKAFALAEARVGHAQNNQVAAGVILGTGVGVGIVIEKQIYFGKDGVAGEFEHVTMLDGTMFRSRRHQAGSFKNATDAKVYLRTLFDMIILSFNPDIIVLGGGWSTLAGMEELANELTTNTGNYESQTPVKISKLQYPGLLGATLFAGLTP